MADPGDPGGDLSPFGMMDIFDHVPSKREKLEMRKAVKRPSEWLRLLCRDWAVGNEAIVEMSDQKFVEFKPYMRGNLTSQLLCRLTLPLQHKDPHTDNGQGHVDFWRILGVHDEFDKSYIVSQIERFCVLYNIRGLPEEEEPINYSPNNMNMNQHQHQHQHVNHHHNNNNMNMNNSMMEAQEANPVATAAAAGISVSPTGGIVGLPPYMDTHHTAAATATAAAAAAAGQDPSKLSMSKKQVSEVSRAHRQAKDAEKALEQERRQNLKKEQKRISQERKEQKQREREALAARKALERTQRESSREDRRKKKLEIRMQREKFAQEQKELALKRAAELVASNRVPIEITRGAAAAKAAASAALVAGGHQPAPEPVPMPSKKPRSAIVVSTAKDLHQIVTHSKNLWAKYNAIAKEHNQKVNWITVAKELGIHVKVREKYARMHSRAEQRGFDWEKNGHFKIKDHPEIFIEPTQQEQQQKMPLPPPDSSTTVLIDGNKEVKEHHYHHHDDSYDPNKDMMADEAVAAAARVVDAAGVSGHHHHHHHVDTVVSPTEEQTAAAAAVAATLVADPTANMMHHEETYHPSSTVC